MTEPQDIRWKQRLQNFSKALARLNEAVELASERKLSSLEEQGLIQGFEFTHELAWNTIKDFFESQGESDILGGRDAVRLAFKRGLIEDGETWMEMIKSRNLTSHTYIEDVARSIAQSILTAYHPAFVSLRDRLESLSKPSP